MAKNWPTSFSDHAGCGIPALGDDRIPSDLTIHPKCLAGPVHITTSEGISEERTAFEPLSRTPGGGLTGSGRAIARTAVGRRPSAGVESDNDRPGLPWLVFGSGEVPVEHLFGTFGGPGLERAGAGFERIGLTPGKPMAALAGATELGGGLLTVAGVADPPGPLAIIGAMTVASATHRASGPLAANRGFELPLTNLATAAALAASGPGRFRLSPPLSRRLTAAVAAGGALMAAASLAKMLTAPRAESKSGTATDARPDADSEPGTAST